MKKSIRDFDLNNKKVIIRVDFNVPMKNSRITNDNRIKMSLNTINYAIEHGAKVILMSHLGRVKEEKDKITNTLKPVSRRLSKLLDKKVIFAEVTRGINLESKINKLKSGEILLMENTRFEDLNGKLESGNDSELGKYWASLGDIFINDAFGTSHRSHASNVGIATNLPSGIGFLIEEEVNKLSIALKPKKPYTVILGGSKVSDKIGVIKNLASIADHILIGGGMAYTFLASEGYNIGSSLLDKDNIEFCKEMLDKYSDKIILPIDTIVSDSIDSTKSREAYINDIKDEEIGLDIGSKTIELFNKYLKNSKTVVWNGPLGMFENKKYSNGTKKIAEYLSNTNSNVIIGGGDTASAVIGFGYKDTYTHISTGGGASLEMLEGKSLPGIEIIQDK